MFNESKKTSEYIYKGKILNLRRDEVEIFGGKTAVREIVEHHGGSAVLCVKDGKILLVKQYRYAFNKEIIEIPAGKINEGENPQETAMRELEEECGIKAKKVDLIYTMYPSPGYTEEVVYIYKAEGIEKGQTHFDEDEDIESFWVETEKAKEMVKSGEIADAKTIIAISHIR